MNRNSLCSDIFSPIRYETSLTRDDASDILNTPSITLTKSSSEKALNVLETPRGVRKADSTQSIKLEKEHRRATNKRTLNKDSLQNDFPSTNSTNNDSVFIRTFDNFSSMKDPSIVTEPKDKDYLPKNIKTRDRSGKVKNAELPSHSNSSVLKNNKKRSPNLLTQNVTVRNGGRKTNTENKAITENSSAVFTPSISVDNSKLHAQALSLNLPVIGDSNTKGDALCCSSGNTAKVNVLNVNSSSRSHLSLNLQSKNVGINQRKKNAGLPLKGSHSAEDFKKPDSIRSNQDIGKINEEVSEVSAECIAVDSWKENVSGSADGTQLSAHQPLQIQAKLIEKLINDTISFEFDAIRQQLYLQHMASCRVLNKKMDEIQEQNAGITEKFCQVIENLSLQNQELKEIINTQQNIINLRNASITNFP